MNIDIFMNTFKEMGIEFLKSAEQMKEEEKRYIDFKIDLKKHDKIKIQFLIEKIIRTTEKKLKKEKVEKIKKEVLKEKKVLFNFLADDINNIINEYKKQLEYNTYIVKLNKKYIEFYGEYLLAKNITFEDIENISGCSGNEISKKLIEKNMCIKPKYNINTNKGLNMKKKELVETIFFQ